MLTALLLIPVIAGILVFSIRNRTVERTLLIAAAAAHTAVTVFFWFSAPSPVFSGWLALDAPGKLFLSITSLLFFLSSFYAVGYLSREEQSRKQDLEEDFVFSNAPEQIFIGSLLFFLATMTLVTLSRNMGLVWVAVEATTLSSAPLIYFHRHHRSLEATWKYLLICSVGIALALLGIFFLAVASAGRSGDTSLMIADLLSRGGQMDPRWLRASFILLLVGFGTKMGLAPMHTWLPDAHSEAPSVVSALLSGALLNCAFLGILRSHQILAASGQLFFGQDLLTGFGLLSMGVAAVFVIRQPDFKRLLAYSSVEHMGILALGVGIGGIGVFGSMLHAVSHSFAKAGLFLVAGNIMTAYKTKYFENVTGMLRTFPVSAVLWIAGFLAITGSPPFGLFISEFTILRAALAQGNYLLAAVYLAVLSLVFAAMTATCLRMTQGEPDGQLQTACKGESMVAVLPPAVLLFAVLVLGVYIPQPLSVTINQIARTIGGAS
jgi:hydrogenase-4 component F